MSSESNENQIDQFWGRARQLHIAAWSVLVIGILGYSATVFGAIFDVFQITNLTKFIAIALTAEALVIIGVALFFVRDNRHFEQTKMIKTLKK